MQPQGELRVLGLQQGRIEMMYRNQASTPAVAFDARSGRRFDLLGLAAAIFALIMLSGCNTTAGVGKDVSATGSALTRGANDVKSGL